MPTIIYLFNNEAGDQPHSVRQGKNVIWTGKEDTKFLLTVDSVCMPKIQNVNMCIKINR